MQRYVPQRFAIHGQAGLFLFFVVFADIPAGIGIDF